MNNTQRAFAKAMAPDNRSGGGFSTRSPDGHRDTRDPAIDAVRPRLRRGQRPHTDVSAVLDERVRGVNLGGHSGRTTPDSDPFSRRRAAKATPATSSSPAPTAAPRGRLAGFLRRRGR